MRKLLVNAGMTSDGVILISHHRHDFKHYTSKAGGRFMLDGGIDYIKASPNMTLLPIYEDTSFEVIRMFLCRGGRGINGKHPLTYTPLCKMEKEWLKACIKDNKEKGIKGHSKWYKKELKYRKKNGEL